MLCDLDGVILDSMTQHARAWQEVLAAEGLTVPVSFILENEGSLGPEVLTRLRTERGGSGGPAWTPAAMAGLLSRQAEFYLRRHAPLVRPYPQAEAFLANLRSRGLPLALVTSSRRAVVQAGLPAGLLARFDALVCAEDVIRHKPHPDPYLAGARALGADPAACLVVENAPAGIQSALAAGATCYALTSTLGAEHLCGAHRIFADLAELAAELEG